MIFIAVCFQRSKTPMAIELSQIERAPIKKVKTDAKSIAMKNEQSRAITRNAEAISNSEMLTAYNKAQTGRLKVEYAFERSHRISQRDLALNADASTAKKQFDLKLPVLGPYTCDFSPNGAALLLSGYKGHIAAMRWRNHSLQCEFQINEHCSAVHYLHDEQLFAVAQSKYTYIYGNDGTEVHQLRDMANISALEFLPQHFLLLGGGRSGMLSWLDVSTGKLIALRRSRLGEICELKRDFSTNVAAAAHECGQVTLWSPQCSYPLLKLAAHRSRVVDLSYDISGTYLVTMGTDGYTRIWDMRMMRVQNQIYTPHGTAIDVSHTNHLGLSYTSRVEVWNEPFKSSPSKKPMLAHNFEKSYLHPRTVKFCPFEDVLGVGHNYGFSSLLVPGAGCPEPDFFSANPYETPKQMRSRPVQQLLDKLSPDTIQRKNAFHSPAFNSKQMYAAQKHQLTCDISELHVKDTTTYASINASQDALIEKETLSRRREDLSAEAERLERQHRNERKIKKMDGVQKHKLKQRRQGRKEVREVRRSLKKQRTLASVESTDIVNSNGAPEDRPQNKTAATSWFAKGK